MLRNWRTPVVIVVTAVLTQVIGMAVHAAVPDALRPVGSTRYAVAAAYDQISTSTTSMVDLPGLSQSITIPEGKRGDIFIHYCGEGSVDPDGTYMILRGMLGENQVGPGSVRLDYASTSGYQTLCASFYKLNVAAGTKNVHLEWWLGSGSATQTLTDRIMTVIVNLHD